MINDNRVRKVLFIGAHWDDLEIGCGGTIAHFIHEGDDVTALIVTHSGYSDENGEVVREAKIARKEGILGLSVLGVKQVHELGLETGRVEYGMDLIQKMEAVIQKIDPDLVFTHWDNDVHQDHSAIGRSTLNVCRKSRSVLMYRSNWYRSSVNFRPSVFVDTSNYFSLKERAINCHQSEVKKYGKNWLNFIKSQDISIGMEFGFECAEAFQAIKYRLI